MNNMAIDLIAKIYARSFSEDTEVSYADARGIEKPLECPVLG